MQTLKDIHLYSFKKPTCPLWLEMYNKNTKYECKDRHYLEDSDCLWGGTEGDEIALGCERDLNCTYDVVSLKIRREYGNCESLTLSMKDARFMICCIILCLNFKTKGMPQAH